MIAITVIVGGCLLLAGGIAVLVAASSAPLGYEDGQGFFEGIEPRSPSVMATGDAAMDGTPDGCEDGLESFEDVEPWPQEGLEADEPVLSAHGASPHAHGVQ